MLQILRVLVHLEGTDLGERLLLGEQSLVELADGCQGDAWLGLLALPVFLGHAQLESRVLAMDEL